MAHAINGRLIAQSIIDTLRKKPRPSKALAVVLVGDDPSSLSFIKKKEAVAKELGIPFALHQYENVDDPANVLDAFQELNERSDIGGIVFQLPVPKPMHRSDFLKILSVQKDVDNLTGKSMVTEPAALTVEAILKSTETPINEAVVAVVGKGFLIGEPVARWLIPRCRRVIVCDRTTGLSNIHEADIVISGVGKAGLIDPAILKKDAAVIDFGYGADEQGRLSGDLDQHSVDRERLSWFTPTPGGTGPILVAKLFENFYRLSNHGG